MFVQGSWHRKNVLARKGFPLFAVLCVVVGAAVLSGCDTGNPTPGILTAKWTNISGGYTTTITITDSSVVYHGTYEAAIVNKPDFTASDGVLIIRFTKYADWDGEPSTTHGNVGKYGALYWKELTASSVSLADAYKKINDTDQFPSHTMFSEIGQAQAAFTNDAVGDYIDWSITSPYTN